MTVEHRIIENEFGYSLPTPSATSYGTNQGGSAGRKGKIRPSLETMARTGIFPTPKATDADHGGKNARDSNGTPHLSSIAGGKLNPEWVEWLMAWPIGWTGLEPLEMDKYRSWLQQHGQSL